MKLTKDNLLLYAQNYYNPKCIDSEEFLEDLKRFNILNDYLIVIVIVVSYLKDSFSIILL